MPADHARVWNTLKAYALSFAVWMTAAFFLGLQIFSNNIEHGHPRGLWESLSGPLREYVPYAIITPAIVWILWRFPVLGARRTRAAIITVGTLLLFSSSHVVLRMLMFPVQSPVTQKVMEPGFSLIAPLMRYYAYEDLWMFCTVAFLANAIQFNREIRKRELAASQLQAQLASSELQMLKHQLQPHFLFNALNSLYALIGQDSAGARRMTIAISEMLRTVIQRSSTDEVAFSEELRFVDRYLEIESMRLGERLRVHRAISPECMDLLVPQLLLQPLVENAIRHGIEKSVPGGDVFLAASLTHGGHLVVKVANSRPAHQGDTTGTGVGLTNLRARLQNMYGDDFVVRVQPTETLFTVEAEIPARTERVPVVRPVQAS
jgi:two-component system, LytTR family, sensor kinase